MRKKDGGGYHAETWRQFRSSDWLLDGARQNLARSPHCFPFGEQVQPPLAPQMQWQGQQWHSHPQEQKRAVTKARGKGEDYCQMQVYTPVTWKKSEQTTTLTCLLLT